MHGGNERMIETRAGDGSVEPTYAIRRWGRNRIEAGGAGKRVLLMPGTGTWIGVT